MPVSSPSPSFGGEGWGEEATIVQVCPLYLRGLCDRNLLLRLLRLFSLLFYNLRPSVVKSKTGGALLPRLFVIKPLCQITDPSNLTRNLPDQDPADSSGRKA